MVAETLERRLYRLLTDDDFADLSVAHPHDVYAFVWHGKGYSGNVEPLSLARHRLRIDVEVCDSIDRLLIDVFEEIPLAVCRVEGLSADRYIECCHCIDGCILLCLKGISIAWICNVRHNRVQCIAPRESK